MEHHLIFRCCGGMANSAQSEWFLSSLADNHLTWCIWSCIAVSVLRTNLLSHGPNVNHLRTSVFFSLEKLDQYSFSCMCRKSWSLWSTLVNFVDGRVRTHICNTQFHTAVLVHFDKVLTLRIHLRAS